MEQSCSSPAAPSGMGEPAASSSRKPRAASMPAPPSLVAEPPMPMRKFRQPRSRASQRSSPTPRVVVYRGLRRSGGTRGSPAAEAISSTAVPVARRMPYSARTGSPSGPVTVQGMRSSGVQRAQVVPSPPSASGESLASRSGQTRRRPVSMAWAASSESRHPFQESMAMVTIMGKNPFRQWIFCGLRRMRRLCYNRS